MYPQQVIDALRHVRYPGTGKDLIESGMLEDDIRISGFEVSFSLIFEKDNDPFMKSVLKAAEVALQTYIDPNISAHIHTKFVKQNIKSQISNLKSPIYSDRPIDIDLIRAFDDSGNEIKCNITNDQNNESPYSEADRSTEGRLEISNHKSQMSSDTLLTLPHPLWQERDFVKIPLAEIITV